MIGACTAPATLNVSSTTPLFSSESSGQTFTPSTPPSRPHCPQGMVLVVGSFCETIDENCIHWANDYEHSQPELRCFEFTRPVCNSNRIEMQFCMDVYEAPNVLGANPIVMTTWFDARNACEAQNKRLCTSNEWTFACEGENLNSFPYGDGLHRDSTACRIDHQTIRYNPARLANLTTRADEARRSYEALPSGQMARCVSWAGVHDMTGNVDEWVENSDSNNMHHQPYHSGLKGGWWGPIRARCRPITDIHGPNFIYYNIGYRCCRNPIY